jgi:hypothetical protein
MVFGFSLGLPSKKSIAEPPASEPAPSGKSTKSALTVNEFVARTKRCREKGLEPTKPELIAYARYLGIDPIVDGDLMWIADEALNAPLPSEWTEHHDSADRVFYYNVQTHASSWTHPLEQLHRDTYKSIVTFRSGDLSSQEKKTELEKLRRKCEESEREAHRELQAWSEHTDEQGQKFYYNREHQRSVWTDPRPARCHSLYLQMKALRVLSKQLGQAPVGNGGLEALGGADSHRDRDHIDKDSLLAPMGQAPMGSGRGSKKDYKLVPMGFDGERPGDEAGGGVGGDVNKKKRKKHKNKEGRMSQRDEDGFGPTEAELSSPLLSGRKIADPFDHHDGLAGKLGDLPGRDLNNSILNRRKPDISTVQEEKAMIMGTASNRGTKLPSLGGRRSDHILDLTGQGDGLSTVGRARVRPGILLEPLQGPV